MRQPDLSAIVTAQLGRPPRGRWDVVVRCPFGFPAVIETDPYLHDGTPFPTLHYLTCPSAVESINLVEGRGGVEVFRRRVMGDTEFAAGLEALNSRYRERRRQRAGGPGVDGGRVLEMGVGGPGGAAKASCLHAYVAAALALTVLEPGDPRQSDWQRVAADMPELWCSDARCGLLEESDARRLAAVDVGTNSVRVLVALAGERARLHTLVRRAEVTRLGAGLRPGGHLDRQAIERTRAAVAHQVEEARGLGAESILLVGTSACRLAADGPDFIRALGDDHAIEARVVSGEQEAALSFAGAVYDVEGSPVVLDVGGGSTELVRGDASRGLDQGGHTPPSWSGTLPGDSVSLQIGCVQATEKWFTSDPPSDAARTGLRHAAREAFADLGPRFGSGSGQSGPSAGLDGSERVGPTLLVGVAGTVTTLACMVLGLAKYDAEMVHLSRMTLDALRDAVDGLADLTLPERTSLPCMQPGRGEVIVAGGEILLAAMEVLGWDALTVSERDLLDGIILERAWAPAPDDPRGASETDGHGLK